MCGIVGFFYSNSDHLAERKVIRRMTESLAHRGPDHQDVFTDRNVALGHARLAVLDLSPEANQPMSNEDGSIRIDFNGEIYNYRDLRTQLIQSNHQFKSNSDTEVIGHAYEEWKTDCFKKFDGMFACAIYDRRKRKLILARDRFGQKPLYYTCQTSLFAFASEIKALKWHPELKFDIDHQALSQYLCYEYVPTPKSIYQRIKKLEPASYLEVSIGNSQSASVNPKKYWQLHFSPKIEISENSAKEKFKDLFIKAVEKRLISDVPLGVFLSGGIDSSAIVWAMSELMDPSQIESFSIGFKEKSFDESDYAQVVADHFGTRHYAQLFTIADLRDTIPEVLALLDEPFADPSVFPTYLLSKFTRQHVTVALGGDGGDELFAGYDTFIASKFAPIVEKFPKQMLNLARWIADQLPVSDRNMNWPFRLQHFLKGFQNETSGMPELRNQLWLSAFTHHNLPLNTSVNWEELFSPTLKYNGNGLHNIDRLSRSYINTYMLDDILFKIDRASMMNSLEVRSPFLDKDLAEFIARLPSTLKMKGLDTKYLFKSAMGSHLPKSILKRSKKGFGIPVAKWIRDELKDELRQAINTFTAQFGEDGQDDYLQNIFNEHINRKTNHQKKLWNIYMFANSRK